MAKSKAKIDPKNPKQTIKQIIGLIIVIIVGILGGYGINLAITSEDGQIVIEASTIELASEQQQTLIGVEGSEIEIDAPTVETVETNAVLDDTQGLGAWYDTDNAMSFYLSVGIGKCLNNAFGAQCFELANQFWWNYAGRGLSSCGTGAARGVFNCDNAGSEFIIINDANELQAGDWAVFNGGQYGHIGQVIGEPHNGYVALFGQNQGGAFCEKGGSATNVINKSLKDFIGAYRPVTYIIPEPEPEVPDTGIVK